jgi:hypothetical protein
VTSTKVAFFPVSNSIIMLILFIEKLEINISLLYRYRWLAISQRYNKIISFNEGVKSVIANMEYFLFDKVKFQNPDRKYQLQLN